MLKSAGTLCTCNQTRCNSAEAGDTYTKEAETAAAVSKDCCVVVLWYCLLSIAVVIYVLQSGIAGFQSLLSLVKLTSSLFRW